MEKRGKKDQQVSGSPYKKRIAGKGKGNEENSR
jgi:hypothetical protein